MEFAVLLLLICAAITFTTIRAIKVKTIKTNLMIDGIILCAMLVVWLVKGAVLGIGICYSILLLWVCIGTLVRIFYDRFDLWFMNLMRKINKMPPYKTIEDLEEDTTHSTRFSTNLYYYAVELEICCLIIVL